MTYEFNSAFLYKFLQSFPSLSGDVPKRPRCDSRLKTDVGRVFRACLDSALHKSFVESRNPASNLSHGL